MKSPVNSRFSFRGLVLAFLTLTILGFAGCASSGPSTGGTNPSVAPGDGSDFSGRYALRAQNCEPFDGIIVFTVTQSGDNLIITVEETQGDTFFPGDQITGMVIDTSGDSIASIQELQCVGKLILTTEEINDANSRLSGGVAQIGDLDAFCQDESADTFCTLIYQHASYD